MVYTAENIFKHLYFCIGLKHKPLKTGLTLSNKIKTIQKFYELIISHFAKGCH